MIDVPTGNRAPYREGDIFLKVDGIQGVAVCRVISDAEFYALMMDAGERLRLSADSHHAPSHLRLLQ